MSLRRSGFGMSTTYMTFRTLQGKYRFLRVFASEWAMEVIEGYNLQRTVYVQYVKSKLSRYFHPPLCLAWISRSSPCFCFWDNHYCLSISQNASALIVLQLFVLYKCLRQPFCNVVFDQGHRSQGPEHSLFINKKLPCIAYKSILWNYDVESAIEYYLL